MATTWIKAVHRTNSGSISAAIKQTLEYAGNPDKTLGGELIAAYGCDPMTAQAEFLLSKRLYEQRTGRNQGKHDVIGYQIRQSFKPGEVTAEEALRIGYELAARWTKGQHQFVVAAHVNTGNPHTHIFYNSVTLDHSRKYADFKRSAIALRRVSDKLCVEQGLSIVENPGLSKGYNRDEYLGGRKPPSGRDNLRQMIDESIVVGISYPDFLARLRKAGCEIKIGKQPSVKPLGSKKFFRLDTLGDDYIEAAIRERLAGARSVEKRNAADGGAERKTAEYTASRNRPSLLIDIQAKIQEGAGASYVQWMRIFNIQTAARTLMFLKEHGIDSYGELCEKSSVASSEFSSRTKRIKEIESRQKKINALQKHIGEYSKTREVYAKYKASGWSQDFFNVHATEILLHRAAKKHFDGLGIKKLPSINTLRQEWSGLEAERRELYKGYHALKEKNAMLGTAKANADVILFGTRQPLQKTQDRDYPR